MELKKYNDVILDENLPENQTFGAVTGVLNRVLMPNKDWSPFNPAKEYQSSLYFDTYNCVAESATSDIETFFNYLLANDLISPENLKWLQYEGYFIDGKINFSARAVGALAGTKVGVGNSGLTIANTIKAYGLMPESRYQFDMRERNADINNPENYYKLPLPQELMDLCKEFKRRFNVDVEIVWSHNVDEVLQFAPVQQFVYAWVRNSEGVYINPDKKTNHAIVRKKDTAKQIFDTYEPVEKELAADYYYYPSGFKYTVTNKIISTPMNLINNQTYLLVEGPSQRYALANNGKLMIADDGKEMFVLLNSAARLGGLDKVKVLPLSLAEWNSVPHTNLKGEAIK